MLEPNLPPHGATPSARGPVGVLQPCRARSALPSSTCEKGALLLLPLVSVTSHCSVLVQRLKSAGQICGGCYASAAPKLVHGGSPAGFIKMMPCLHIALSVMATFTELTCTATVRSAQTPQPPLHGIAACQPERHRRHRRRWPPPPGATEENQTFACHHCHHCCPLPAPAPAPAPAMQRQPHHRQALCKICCSIPKPSSRCRYHFDRIQMRLQLSLPCCALSGVVFAAFVVDPAAIY